MLIFSLLGESINRKLINQISMELNEETLLPYRFDIVDYSAIQNVELANHIQRVGK